MSLLIIEHLGETVSTEKMSALIICRASLLRAWLSRECQGQKLKGARKSLPGNCELEKSGLRVILLSRRSVAGLRFPASSLDPDFGDFENGHNGCGKGQGNGPLVQGQSCRSKRRLKRGDMNHDAQ